MSLMEKLEDFVDRITTGEQMQYVLAGTLILIIIISLSTVIMNLTGSSRTHEIKEMHFYCLETDKEFVVKPEDLYKNENMMEPEMMGPMGMYMMSPYTNERTAVPMTLCPNCKKYFVPEYYLQEHYDDEAYYMMDQGNLICPHCKTDIIQWYRDHRKRRR